MSHKFFLYSILDAFAALFFFKYILPIIIIIFIILFGITKVNSNKIAQQHEPDSIIIKSNIGKDVVEYLEGAYDKNEVVLEKTVYITDGFCDVELEYSMLNKNYTIEQYNNVINDTITRVYERLKNKEVIEDRILLNKDDVVKESIKLYFSIDGSFETYLTTEYLQYDSNNKWEKSYKLLMNEQHIQESNFEQAKKFLLLK